MADALTMQFKGPRPVLDNFEQAEDLSDTGSERTRNRPRFAPRLDLHQSSFATLNRSSTQLFAPGSRSASRNASPAPSGRPGLQRAKSDFGPRREEAAKTSDEEGHVGKEGEWGIRHGYETQLESEEYNRLLESVSHVYLPRASRRFC